MDPGEHEMTRKFMTMAWLVAATTLPLSAQPRPAAATPRSATGTAPSSQPVDPAVLDTTALRASVDRKVRQLLEVLRSDRFKDRQAAQQALAGIEKGYLDSLFAAIDDADPEVRARILEAMATAMADAQLTRFMARLAPEDRKKMVRLQQTSPQIVTDAFSPAWNKRVKAIESLAAADDPDRLAEPLLIVSINHPSPDIVTAAMKAVSTGKYKSDSMVDSLCAILRQGDESDWSRLWYDREHTDPHFGALSALQAIKSPRAVPGLLALLRDHRDSYNMGIPVAEAIAAIDEKRAIPTLINGLADSSSHGSWGCNNVTITLAASDWNLMALVKLTGQSPGKYGFLSLPSEMGEGLRPYGFKDEKDRDAAIKKFREWWAAHKGDAEYKDLKPLDLPAPSAPPQENP
jgi:hypothetical protein